MGFKWTPGVESQIVALILIAMTIWPLILPPHIPVKITQETIDFYNAIEGIPKGGAILYDESSMIMNWFTNCQTSIATLNHIIKRIKAGAGLKLLLYTSFDVSSLMGLEKIRAAVPLNELKYGEDWVYLGFVPGWETTLAGMRTNIRAVIATDYFGNPLDT